MSSMEQGKSGGKSGRRSRKGERTKKTVATAAEIQAIEQALSVGLNSPEPEQPTQTEADQTPGSEPQPILAEQIEPVAVSAAVPADVVPVNLQTIANAYRDYTRKSFAEFSAYLEQLAATRSLDKAMIVQGEFVKRAYATTVAESQRILELHGRLARQSLQPLHGLTNQKSETGRTP